MGYEDRSWYRDNDPQISNPILRAGWWVLTGRVRLFEVFGITVNAHAGFIVVTALILMFGFGFSSQPTDRIQVVLVLWGSVLLHEFGHCWGARRTGGNANEILLTPLGGLAFTQARRRPWPTFVTVACGPLVTLALFLVGVGGLYLLLNRTILGPWSFAFGYSQIGSFFHPAGWLFWLVAINFAMLVFNLLPFWPLDGGQALQSILWKPLGYYRSMVLALNVGIAGNLILMMIGLAGGPYFGGPLTFFIGAFNLLSCIQFRRFILAEGPWGFSDEDTADYGNPWENEPERKPGMFERLREKRATQRATRKRQSARHDERRLDNLLSKIGQSGIDSLSRSERKELERLRQRKSTPQK